MNSSISLKIRYKNEVCKQAFTNTELSRIAVLDFLAIISNRLQHCKPNVCCVGHVSWLGGFDRQ